MITTPSRRQAASALLALAAMMTAGACSVANSGPEPSAGGAAASTVRIVLPEEPPTLEPCDASLTATGRVTRANITEALTERDPGTGELKPALSTEWKQDSPTEWTFTLRKDVKFHDGSAFDAKAAAFSIDRTLNPKVDCNVNGYVFGGIKLTATAVDDVTLKVKTAKADPILPLRLSFVEIVPTTTNATGKVREPVGTGPYKIAKWDAGRSLRLEKYAGYWGKAPEFAAAEYVWRAEGSIRAAMVKSDEADIAVGLAPEDGAGDSAVQFPNNETSYLRIDATKPPLNDIRVRQAINYAIDKDGLVASVFAGLGKSAGQIVPEGVTGHSPAIQPWPYDMNQAKKLIAEAKADGVPTGTAITIIGRNGIYPKAAEAMEVVQNSLMEAGLSVKIQMLDVNAWLEYLLAPFPKDAGPTLLQAQHGNQAGDAAFTMGQIYGSKGAQSSYGTKELDELISTAEQASGAERQAAFAKALEYQNKDVVRDAVLAHMTGILALSKKVTYKPDAATNDEMRLADIHPAG
ncbi:peptide/nickel transport system substrate-binding protein [Nonomuraea solani]|uniref:Peptide/nickel transport system substrate-binding protein n=1 Tax=Nonomuraea solani TaxID=1144553 RepID=A0A1H6E3Z6_9ACTN|nr:ABC transporter substrate-binding protein [Nonomuraea solani]SEG92051.1 peptide/nickel transport system substrate-binding protein [Nonomuraea solani]